MEQHVNIKHFRWLRTKLYSSLWARYSDAICRPADGGPPWVCCGVSNDQHLQQQNPPDQSPALSCARLESSTMLSCVPSMPAHTDSSMQEQSARGVYVCVQLPDVGRDNPGMLRGATSCSGCVQHLSEHHTSGKRGTSTHAQNARFRSVSLISSPCTDLNHCLQADAALAEQTAGGSDRCRRQDQRADVALSQPAAAQPFPLDAGRVCASACLHGQSCVLHVSLNPAKPSSTSFVGDLLCCCRQLPSDTKG